MTLLKNSIPDWKTVYQMKSSFSRSRVANSYLKKDAEIQKTPVLKRDAEIQKTPVDTHGQSEVAFAFSWSRRS